MWYYKLATYLEENGFVNDDSHPCILIRRDDNEFATVAVYVDDLNIIDTKQAVVDAKKMMIKDSR